MPGFPRDPALDATVALWNEGYGFISRRCNRLGSDVFHTRLMLRPVLCARGAERRKCSTPATASPAGGRCRRARSGFCRTRAAFSSSMGRTGTARRCSSGERVTVEIMKIATELLARSISYRLRPVGKLPMTRDPAAPAEGLHLERVQRIASHRDMGRNRCPRWPLPRLRERRKGGAVSASGVGAPARGHRVDCLRGHFGDYGRPRRLCWELSWFSPR
jgi:hypothetical protein